jgi:hypothetical protein
LRFFWENFAWLTSVYWYPEIVVLWETRAVTYDACNLSLSLLFLQHFAADIIICNMCSSAHFQMFSIKKQRHTKANVCVVFYLLWREISWYHQCVVEKKSMWIERIVCHKSNDRWGKNVERWRRERRAILRKTILNARIFKTFENSTRQKIKLILMNIFKLVPLESLNALQSKNSSTSFMLLCFLFVYIFSLVQNRIKTLLIIKKFMTKFTLLILSLCFFLCHRQTRKF